MKPLRQVLATAALALALPAGSVEPLPDGSRQMATASFTATANVVSGLALSKTADLELGAVTPGDGGGSVTVSPDDARRASGGVSTAASGWAAARFAVSGASADTARLRVSLPERVVLTGGSGGGTLTARSFTGRLVGSGAGLELVVGATVDVGARQPAGRYTGTFTVTVNES